MKILFVALMILLATMSAGCSVTGQIDTTENATSNTSSSVIGYTILATDAAGNTVDIWGPYEEIAEAAQGLVAVFEFAAGALIILFTLVIVLWRGDVILYFIASLVTFFIAITWASTYSGASYVFMVLSSYEMLRGLIMAILSDAPACGISQFKALVSKIKGWF